ncbi:nuclear GTPase SLIP-GC isoform X4 [Salmo salar]|uniref:Nuclear GTPase SLIP-GC isoform X4 n=1 Tax=Salmo salar TaxID=8030 RepID=A0ABM3EKJ9_SALSA|nr:nuclear GTPase SLIP-GC-like isoform X4 [Salmo salar]
MASFDFVRDKLTEWNHSDLIQRFEDEEIDEESFLSLKEKDFINLIPKIGPRSAFREKHKAFIKKQKQPDDDKNIQAATWSSVSIKASKSSSENITGEMVNQEPRQKNIKPRNQTPKRSETKRSLDKLLGTCGGSVPTTNTSGVGETVYDQSEPSTCHGCRKEKRTKVQRKRKSDEAHANKQTKKRQCVAASRITETFETETKTEVKKIMQHVKSKLDDLPSTKLIDFLRGKIQTLEKDKKEIVGVFGKTGAGKSFLINTILGETKLLPSGNQGACTSVMIQVEANMTDSKYIAEIEFMTEEEWKEELLSILRDRSYKDGNDEDHERDDDDDDDEKISSLYGKDGRGATLEELMDRKHFRKIPEFRLSVKKIFLCDTAEKLSETITCYTRSDTQSDTFKRQYWPLVKCITIKVPNSKDLLEDVVLVDLPGNGDCNKSRDEMWKSFVGNCSAVWIVSDIARATSEKESWEILDSTVSLFGPGGECRSISFICTKTDDIEENQKADARTCILRRNETTKRQVRDKFNKQKEVKKHFSGGKDFLQVFTVSSKEYQKEKHLQQEETEIPKLQEFLRNLNDRRTKTSGYVSGAYGILSLIEGAKSSDMVLYLQQVNILLTCESVYYIDYVEFGFQTDSKEEVCQVLEQRLKDEIKSIGQTIYEAYETFERCLSEGVRQSEESCEKLMNKVIAPRGKKGCGYQVVKSLCKNGGVYKPKGKRERRREINLNESLASCMRSLIDEQFKIHFPNEGKGGPIREQIDTFTLDTNSLVGEHPGVSLHLTFLKTEETELKAKLIFDLREKKKKIYSTLTESIKDTMLRCYIRASEHAGKDSLKRMKDELHHHMKNNNIFRKAKEDMLVCLTNLKDHIMMQLKCKLQESMDLSLKTPNSSFLPDDVTVEYNKMKMYYEKLMGCSSTVQFTPRLDLHTKTKVFESQSGNSRKCVQVSTSVTMLNPEIVKELTTHDRKPTYRLQCPKAGLFQCSSTGLVFLMEGKGDVVYMMTQWDSRLLGSMTPAGPLFSIDCSEQSVRQLHLPHCMCDEKDEKLSVAHVTDGNMEIVQPLKTTATHVIVNITHLSLFGLIRDVFSILPVRSQVLLFLQPQGNRPQNCILNVILLPKNVPLCEVEHQQKGSTFIQSSSNCTLSPRGKYGLCCELVANSRIQPTSGQFDYDYSPNFHPTFQVFLDGMSGAENIRLSLLDRGRNDQIVWECLIPTDFEPPHVNPINLNPGAEPELNKLSGEAFVDKHMADLIQRVTMVQYVAGDLLVEEMIPDELYSRILMASPSQVQMRLMFDAVQVGGTTVKSAFYKALLNHEPRLVQDLAAYR